jgi:two-component system sensor histidine kinase KdpD
VRAAAAALIAPAAATLLSLAFPHSGPATAESIYLLGVVLAAASGGIWGGLGAALLSFVALNFFFFAPRHTLAVRDAEAVLALVVFLIVAAVVGVLLARSLRERARAEAREKELRVLNRISETLLASDSVRRNFESLTADLISLLGLSDCSIDLDPEADANSLDDAGRTMSFPLELGTVRHGRLLVARRQGPWPFAASEIALLRTVARQLSTVLERRRLDEAVRDSRVEAESSELRAALFSSITHDLKTPLASIKAGATSLRGDGPALSDEQRDDLLQTIEEEVDRLNRLVGNILDLARLRADALRPTVQPISVDEIVESAVARMRGRLTGFDVRVKIPPDVPPVPADPVQIDQVVTNLLENATRFAPPGSDITIAVNASPTAVRVRVADHGPGIPPEERDRVFEEFYRIDARPESVGTGLGLTISRAIVVAHGGRMWIEGNQGGGAAVAFELPIDSPVAGDGAPASNGAS